MLFHLHIDLKYTKETCLNYQDCLQLFIKPSPRNHLNIHDNYNHNNIIIDMYEPDGVTNHGIGER